MPRERTDLIRLGKFLEKGKIFVLSYEGNDTEPQYYEALKEKLKYKEFTLHIESLKRIKSDTNSAPKHVFNKLIEKRKEYHFKDDDEFWMIIDRDRWKLDEWVEKCKNEKNFYIALSNPCFEFWLLLHIKNIDEYSEEEIKDIFENKKISKKRTHLEKILSELLADGYSKSNLKPERFLKNIDTAIQQAKKLSGSDILENLGSNNYVLVEKLIN